MSKIHKPWVSHEELDAFLGGGILDVFPHAASHETGGDDLIDALTFSNEGLHILDLGGDHDLIIKPGTDLSANRILTLTTGDAARTITLSGNPTLADWFDQPVKQASSPTFVTAKLSALTNGYIPYHVSDAAGLANSGLFWDNANSRLGINDNTPSYELDVNGTIQATTLRGNLHWNYITNEPAFYPPEYHYHVGKDIVSLHLVDLDDVEADDIFDVLPTAAIHGEGNYDWFGTWDTTAAANTSAEIVVLAGDDKYLRLTDNSGTGQVDTEIVADPGHEMLNGVIEFKMRQSVNNLQGYFSLYKGAVRVCAIQFWSDGQIRVVSGGLTTDMQAYAANTWYKIRIYYDCISRYVAIFVDNVFKKHQVLAADADADYVDRIKVNTSTPNNGYTLDINNLKIFNLTV